jgi:hypothetical protein
MAVLQGGIELAPNFRLLVSRAEVLSVVGAPPQHYSRYSFPARCRTIEQSQIACNELWYAQVRLGSVVLEVRIYILNCESVPLTYVKPGPLGPGIFISVQIVVRRIGRTSWTET